MRHYAVLVDRNTLDHVRNEAMFTRLMTELRIRADDLVEIHSVGQHGALIAPATVGLEFGLLSGQLVRDPGPRVPADTAEVSKRLFESQAVLNADGERYTTSIVVVCADDDGRIARDLSRFGTIVHTPLAGAADRATAAADTFLELIAAQIAAMEEGLNSRAKPLPGSSAKEPAAVPTRTTSAPGGINEFDEAIRSWDDAQMYPESRTERTAGPSMRAVSAAIAALSLLVGLVAYYATEGSFTGGATSSNTTSASPALIGIPLTSFYDLSPGECTNRFPYATKLNAPELRKVPCDNAAARMKLQFVTHDGASRPCNIDTTQYLPHGDALYCFEFRAKPGYCYPAWVGDQNGGLSSWTALTLPHACDESIVVPDELLPKPTDAMGATNIRRVDLRVLALTPTGDETSCQHMALTMTAPADPIICAEVA